MKYMHYSDVGIKREKMVQKKSCFLKIMAEIFLYPRKKIDIQT